MGTRADTDDSSESALAAVFSGRDAAHRAAHRLHDEGFRKTWIGVTKTSEDAGGGTFAGDAGGAMTETTVEAENWFQRFFGEGEATLHDALLRHGVDAADAAGAGAVSPGSAVLTVDGANNPAQAAQIIAQCGGRLITSGATATSFVDEDRRSQLRDERLTSDTPGARGDAPVVREEFFIERGPGGATSSGAGATTTADDIGKGL